VLTAAQKVRADLACNLQVPGYPDGNVQTDSKRGRSLIEGPVVGILAADLSRLTPPRLVMLEQDASATHDVQSPTIHAGESGSDHHQKHSLFLAPGALRSPETDRGECRRHRWLRVLDADANAFRDGGTRFDQPYGCQSFLVQSHARRRIVG
jgi:hypothetical protein